MRSIALFLACFLIVVTAFSCVSKPDYVGTWKGEVLIVSVEFKFKTNTYESKTLSFNDVMISGAKGTIEVSGGKMKVHETERYHFYNATNTGEWLKSDDRYTMSYKVEGDKITLRPSTSKDEMVLMRD